MIEKRERTRRDGSTLHRLARALVRRDAAPSAARRSTAPPTRAPSRRKIRTLKRTGALADLDAGSETLAEFVEEWWMVYAGPNLERATLRAYAQLLERPRAAAARPAPAARAHAADDRALPRRARGRRRRRRGDPQDDDDAPGRPAARGRVGPRADQRGQDHAQAAEAATGRRSQAIPPALIEVMRARLLERRPAARRDAARRARLRRAAAAGGARARVAPRARAHAARRARAQRRPAQGAQEPPAAAHGRAARAAARGPRRVAAAPARRRRRRRSSRRASGAFWRATDWRNWRKRIYKPVAESVGIDGARPYDLRHAFASLLIHEGRLSVVEIAAQLGHNPTVCLDTYAHVMAEQRGASRSAPKRDPPGAQVSSRPRRTQFSSSCRGSMAEHTTTVCDPRHPG